MITGQEHEVVDHLVRAWNAFLDLPVEHPDERDEFRHAIHAAQHIVLARSAARFLNALPPGTGPSLITASPSAPTRKGITAMIEIELTARFLCALVQRHDVTSPGICPDDQVSKPVIEWVRNDPRPTVETVAAWTLYIEDAKQLLEQLHRGG